MELAEGQHFQGTGEFFSTTSHQKRRVQLNWCHFPLVCMYVQLVLLTKGGLIFLRLNSHAVGQRLWKEQRCRI